MNIGENMMKITSVFIGEVLMDLKFGTNIIKIINEQKLLGKNLKKLKKKRVES